MDGRKGGTGMIMKATFTLELPGLIMIIVLFALCFLFMTETTKARIIIVSVAAAFISVSIAAYHNPTAEFSEQDMYTRDDGHRVIAVDYRLHNMTNRKYRLEGTMKIRDEMTGKEWKLKTSDEIFGNINTFTLEYVLPKELAEQDITNATYTAEYASGYRKQCERFTISYADNTAMHVFKNPMLKLSDLGRQKDKIVSRKPDTQKSDD